MLEVDSGDSKLRQSKPAPTASLYARLYLFQIKALFFKNLSLQSKQVSSNLCHMLTPVCVLILLQIMVTRVNDIVSSNQPEFSKRQLFPMMHNMPLNIIKNSSLYPIFQDTCLRVVLAHSSGSPTISTTQECETASSSTSSSTTRCASSAKTSKNRSLFSSGCLQS